jgi:hypothetical protein
MLASTMTCALRTVQVVHHRMRLALSLAALGILVGTALVGCGQASVPNPTCGTLVIDHLGQVNSAQAEQVETCFYQGFQRCSSVSLELSHMSGVDTATESIFIVQATHGSSCQIAETDYNIVNISVTQTATVTCTGLSRQSGGLLISSCGSGHNVSIPAPTAPTSSSETTSSSTI